MKNRIYLWLFFLIVTGLPVAGGWLIEGARADTVNLSGHASQMLELAEAGDLEGLLNFLPTLSGDERVAAVSQLARQLSPRQIRQYFPLLFQALAMNQPPGGQIPELLAAIEAAEGSQAVISSALQGILVGTVNHPALESNEQRADAVAAAAADSAAAVIALAEATARIDAANAAYAVTQGVVAGIADAPFSLEQISMIARAMAQAGVEAAIEDHRPAVARAMMLMMGSLEDPEIRRAFMAGIYAGGEAAGGSRAARAMDPIERQLARVLPVLPQPIAPELFVPPAPDQASPF